MQPAARRWTLRPSSNGRFWPSCRRGLAAAYEEAGEVDQAIATLDRFVRLWERGDPMVQPVVADARDRMARLIADRG